MEPDRKFRVLVIGDVMLDQYTHVRSDRRAQEADIPVWDETRQEYRLGGAANVAHNIKAIGGDEIDVHLAGLAGSSVVLNTLDNVGVNRDRVMGHDTMVKRRIIREEKILARIDNFRKFDPKETDFFRDMIQYWEVPYDAVIYSDYDKGTLTPDVIETVRRFSKLHIVDSKRKDLRMFDGMDVLKVNESEYSAQVSNSLYHNFMEFFRYVVVTRGSDGASLFMCDHSKSVPSKPISHGLIGATYTNHSEEFPVIRAMAKDVTGCGDTHTAGLTFGLLKTGDIRSAVKFANTCAAQVVQKFGTAVP